MNVVLQVAHLLDDITTDKVRQVQIDPDKTELDKVGQRQIPLDIAEYSYMGADAREWNYAIEDNRGSVHGCMRMSLSLLI